MPNVPESKLREIVTRYALAMGASEAAAANLTESLVSSNMEGLDSHGVIRLPQYLKQMDQGFVKPAAVPTVVRRDRAVAVVDGGWAYGQVAGRVAARVAVDLAREHGIGAAGLFRVHHVGRLKDYVQIIGRENMIGLAFVNAGPKGGLVTPFRGSLRRFGTNPLAYSVPRPSGDPLVADFATSVTAEGKVRVALNSHKRLADGTIIDAAGNPSNDPAQLYAGGALLPFAQHKGYCLSLFIDIVGGLLCGAGAASLSEEAPGNGMLLIALDVSTMRDDEAFMADVEALLGIVKETPAAAGQEPVLLPGEPEVLARAQRSTLGVPIDETTWSLLVTSGTGIGLPQSLFETV